MYKFLCRHMEHCCANSNWLRHCRMFSKVLVSFYIPTSNVWGFWLFHIFTTLIRLLGSGYSSGYGVVFCCGFSLHSLDHKNVISSFLRGLLKTWPILLLGCLLWLVGVTDSGCYPLPITYSPWVLSQCSTCRVTNRSSWLWCSPASQPFSRTLDLTHWLLSWALKDFLLFFP